MALNQSYICEISQRNLQLPTLFLSHVHLVDHLRHYFKLAYDPRNVRTTFIYYSWKNM